MNAFSELDALLQVRSCQFWCGQGRLLPSREAGKRRHARQQQHEPPGGDVVPVHAPQAPLAATQPPYNHPLPDLPIPQPCVARTPTVTYLGLSPPVRSGATNPFTHDRSWTRSAYSASHTNLEALRELDSTGESFLRSGRHAAGRLGGSGGAMSVDAAALVLASPDVACCALEEAVAADEEAAAAAAGRCGGRRRGGGSLSCGIHAAAAAVSAEESLSDAGSDSTQVAAAAAAAPASAAPGLLLHAPHAPAAALARSRLMGGCGCVQPTCAPASLVAQPGAVVPGAARPPAAPRPHGGGGAPTAAAKLEPFACHTQYYYA
jgi:hypothetical protein